MVEFRFVINSIYLKYSSFEANLIGVGSLFPNLLIRILFSLIKRISDIVGSLTKSSMIPNPHKALSTKIQTSSVSSSVNPSFLQRFFISDKYASLSICFF